MSRFEERVEKMSVEQILKEIQETMQDLENCEVGSYSYDCTDLELQILMDRLSVLQKKQ